MLPLTRAKLARTHSDVEEPWSPIDDSIMRSTSTVLYLGTYIGRRVQIWAYMRTYMNTSIQHRARPESNEKNTTSCLVLSGDYVTTVLVW